MLDWASLALVGFVLIVVGFVLIFLSIAISVAKTKSAGIILVGPFPIIIGTDKESVKILLILTIVVIALMILLLLLNYYTT